MNSFSILPSQNKVIVDGRGITMAVAVPPDVQSVEWSGVAGVITYYGKPPQTFTDASVFQAILDAWQTLANLADNPPPPVAPEGVPYYGAYVKNAADVDMVTIKRIWGLVRTDTNDATLLASTEMRHLKNIVIAIGVLIDPNATTQAKADAMVQMQAELTLNAQVDAIRAEGTAFKTANGW